MNRDHSSESFSLPSDKSASPPQTCGSSSAAARPNPHRQLCTGDTVSASVTRCAPRVTTQMGVRSSAAIAARKSRRVPPRFLCCIRNNDRIEGVVSESRAAMCTIRSAGSSTAAERNASASFSSSASDTGNARIRGRWPRAVSTSTKGFTASVASPMRIQADPSPASAPESGAVAFSQRISYRSSVIDWVVRCWLCCAASLVSTLRV